MGYITKFDGKITVEPPLNAAEVEYLRRFANSRRVDREDGPYCAPDDGQFGQSNAGGVKNHNMPPAGQPGLWCNWEPTEDGTAIQDSDLEASAYNPEEWMQYLIDHFLKPGAVAYRTSDPQFNEFTFDHVLNGTIDAEGEEPGDIWRLKVRDNVVTRQEAVVSYEDDEDES